MPLRGLCLLLALALAPVAPASEKQRAADRAAGKWLALVDAGDYRESWRRAATLFRQQVSERQWIDAVGALRKPLGAMLSRRLVAATYTTSLPGAPYGEYVVLEYRSEFRQLPSAIETVTPMLDRGRWRVSGYYLRRAPQ